MNTIIYIQQFEEGTPTYRPVPAIKLYNKNVYILKGEDIYDPEDEVWEFKPGTHVIAEKRKLSDGMFLIAVKEHK